METHKIYLTETSAYTSSMSSINDKPVQAFNMKHKEKHMAQLYADFPLEHKALDEFMVISDRALAA